MYKIYVDCSNCGKRKEMAIKEGQEIKDTPCENCGCKTLSKAN